MWLILEQELFNLPLLQIPVSIPEESLYVLHRRPYRDPNQTFNEGNIEDIVVNPSDVTWFATEDDALNTEPLPAGTVLVDGSTYYAVFDGPCYSEPFAVTVTLILSVIDLENGAIKVFPNPSSDFVTVESSRSSSEHNCFQPVGAASSCSEGNGEFNQVDVSNLDNGIYLLTIQVGSDTLTVQIIKVKLRLLKYRF